MTDIVLPPVTGANNISTLNDNFRKVQESINNDVLNLSGGNNVMAQDLDMNGNDLLNVSTNVNNPNSLLTVGAGDARYYNVAGDTLQGPMSVNNNVISGLRAAVGPTEPVRKQEFDAAIFDSALALRQDLAQSSGSSLVGFLQNGVGAVARTVQDKEREEVNALDFGVVVNDLSKASSNLVAMNKAITYLNSVGGGNLNLPAGTIYTRRVDGASTPEEQYIILKKGVYLIGQGKTATKLVRYGPHTILNTIAGQDNSDIAIQNMTLDGNPSVVGFTNFAANLSYIVDGNGVVFANVLFKNCPGLHSTDINGSNNIYIYGCEFQGNDNALSLAFGGASYFPESVQIGKHPTTFAMSSNIILERCIWGPSADLPAPFVAVGNHSSGGAAGLNARTVKVRGGIATGMLKYFVRPFCFDDVEIEDVRSTSTVGGFAFVCGSNVSGTITTSSNITVRRVYFDGDDIFFQVDAALIAYPSVARFTGLVVDKCVVVGRTNRNAISIVFSDNILINTTKVTGAARSVLGTAVTNIRVINPDFTDHNVSGIEVTGISGAGTLLSGNVTVSGGRVTQSQFYAVNLQSVNGYLIESTDVSGASMLDNTRGPILSASQSQSGRIVGLVGYTTTNTFQPLFAVSVTSGLDVTVGPINVHHTGPNAVINNATGRTYGSKQFGFRPQMPGSGTWEIGDYIKNSAPVVGQPKGWVRITSGSGNVLNTDWVSEGNL